MKPRILLSANKNKEYYIDAVNLSGGIAEAKYCPEVSLDYDGLILCGGNDINPELYKEVTDGATDIDYGRDSAEVKIAKAFIEAKKPIMGICRGHQLLNVIFGGSLYQDIPNWEFHTNKSDFYCVHNVTACEKSVFERWFGRNFSVNSSHHQAVKVLGENLCTTLTADGLIEGFKHNTLPIFGVQFHPERMCFSQKRNDTVDGAEIFRYFIELCRK